MPARRNTATGSDIDAVEPAIVAAFEANRVAFICGDDNDRDALESFLIGAVNILERHLGLNHCDRAIPNPSGLPIIERDDSEFESMCAQHGLVPAAPKIARNLKCGDVLFAPNGVPLTIEHIHSTPPTGGCVRLAFKGDAWPGSGMPYKFDPGETISLIASASADQTEGRST